MEFLILISAHFLADLPLQGEWVARNKQDAFKTQLGTICLIGHSFIQGFVVAMTAYLLIGCDFNLVFGVVAVTHGIIDYGKIRGYYGAAIDQMMHYVVLALILLC